MSEGSIVPRSPGNRIPADAPLGRRRRQRPPDMSGLGARSSSRGSGYAEFMSAAERFVETPPARSSTAAGYVLCGALVAFLAWSMFGFLPMFAIAPGEVISRGGTQTVESRTAGTVTALSAAEGAHVAKGAVLVQLDATAEIADRTVVVAKMDDLKAEVARRTVAIAAVRKDPVAIHDAVSWADDIPAPVRAREDEVLRTDLAEVAATIADLQSQRAAKATSRDRFTANIAAETSLIEARTERTGMHQQLADKGWDSRATVLAALEPLRQEQVSLATLQGSLAEAEAAIPVLDREIADARQTFVTDNTQKIADAGRQLDELGQRFIKADEAVGWKTLKAPVAGVVHALAVTTVGQSVRAGQQLLQIVPDGTPIGVTAYVLNTDIGFVQAGQPVTIKVDTFPYTRYGTIPGHVVKVAPDAIPGRLALAQQRDGASPQSGGPLSATSAVPQTSDLVFPVQVAPDRDWIAVGERRIPLVPGMSLAVEIETERQRAIAYVLYPLVRAFSQQGPGQ